MFIAAAMVACGDDGGEEVVVVEQSTDIAASSFTLESPEGTTFAWTEGSRLSLFRSNTNERFAYDAAGDVFKKEDKLKMGEPFENAYAVYPYKGTNRVSNGDIKTEVPAAQTYSADGVNFEDAPMVGMSATASDPTMELKNLCGVAVVKLYGSAIVKSVAITGNNGEVLAGTAMAEIGEDGNPTFDIVALQNNTVTLTAEEPVALGATAEEATPFYLLVPPTTFENGFVVTIVDSYGNIRKKNFKVDEENPAASIARNEVAIIAEYELAEKKPLQTILDVQFNEDGTAVDEGIYGLDVTLVGDINPYVYTYKHPKFKANNIARFGHIAHNDGGKKFSYYKVDYSANEEMKATIADGFALEVVYVNTAWSWDWWSVPVSTNAFRLMRKGDLDKNAWNFTFNEGGGWWPGNVTGINATLEKNKYHHTIYMYDADNQCVQVYQDGILLGMREGIAEFNPGAWLTIGGFTEGDGSLFMQWNGEVALVKMYDQAMTADEVATKFNDLKLPDAPAEPASPALSTPLFDIKWNADKTATNAGTQTSLEILSKPNDNTTIIDVEGYGKIANFNNEIHNRTYADGWYRIDYSSDEDFRSKLQNGFSMEMLVVSNFDQGQFWMRPFSTNKWGIMLKDGDRKRWVAFANSADNDWSAYGNSQNNGYEVYVKDQITKDESFSHLVYIWNAEAKEWGTYVDGNFNGGHILHDFNVGTIMNINGMPYTDRLETAHGWNGKVAMVRIYDEVMTQDQVLHRFADLQDEIQKLNTTIQ